MAKTKEKTLAKELFLQGKLQKEIADLIGVQEKTVSNWVNKFGWKNERDARLIGKRSQEAKLRELIGTLAEQSLRYANEMELAHSRNDVDAYMDLQKKANAASDAASKWNKQLEAIAKENKTSLSTYIQVMEDIFEGLRQYSPKLYMDLVEFQEQHLSDVSIKLG